MKISYIIPHYNRNGVLRHHLDLLQLQTATNFEVIVVDDGSDPKFEYETNKYPFKIIYVENGGPAKARNVGVKESTGDVLLFVGDDTVPHVNLIAFHTWEHMTNPGHLIQGITPFHPDCMDTTFMHILDSSGIQANWMALRDKNDWKREIDGFLLTTNVSMSRKTYNLIGGFDEDFTNAAWEDISFGITARKIGVKTLFNPSAVNLHIHKYNLYSYCERQKMEGRNRILASLKHPDLSHQLIQPDSLRFARQKPLRESIYRAEVELRAWEPNSEVIRQCLSHASFVGLLEKLDEFGGPYRIYEHIHKPDTIFAVTNGIKAYEDGNKSYAEHCIEWAIDTAKDNWALYSWAGDILKHFNEIERANSMYDKSLVVTFNDWAFNGTKNE